MKIALPASLAAAVVATLAPSVALACPASGQCGGLGSLFGYAAALGIGLGVGVGSVALEKKLKKR